MRALGWRASCTRCHLILVADSAPAAAGGGSPGVSALDLQPYQPPESHGSGPHILFQLGAKFAVGRTLSGTSITTLESAALFEAQAYLLERAARDSSLKHLPFQ